MEKTITINLEEARRVFLLLERVQAFTHQPMHYDDVECVERFATENYHEIRDLYYDVVWGWLPKDVQRELMDD